MDYTIELPPSEGFTVIFVVVDKLTKMVHFIPRVFIRAIVWLHGVPSNVISNRAVQFISRFWKFLCQALKIKLAMSSAYHPQSNG